MPLATVTAETGVIQLVVPIVATDRQAGGYSGPNVELSGRQRRDALDSERKMGRRPCARCPVRRAVGVPLECRVRPRARPNWQVDCMSRVIHRCGPKPRGQVGAVTDRGCGSDAAGSALLDWRCRIGAAGLALPDWRRRIGAAGLALPDWRCRIGAAGLAPPDWRRRTGLSPTNDERAQRPTRLKRLE